MYANVMNLRALVVAAAVAASLALGGAGIAHASGADSGERVTGSNAEEARSAALAAVGGGTVTEVERDDGDDGFGAGGFEVEVERADGGQVEVHLDGDHDVVGREADDDGPGDRDGPDDD